MSVIQVLIELVSVREGSFYLPEFDDVCIRQFVDCICQLSACFFLLFLTFSFVSVLGVRF